MEMLAWTDGVVDYATTVFWYGDADARAEGTSHTEEARWTLPPRPADPAQFRIPGAIEFENLGFVRKSNRLQSDRQAMDGFPEGMWSGQMQLVGFAGGAGDFMEFEVADLPPAVYRMHVYATKAADYGTVRLSANGSRPKVFDAFSQSVTDSGAIDLGRVEVRDGRLLLRVEVIGKNDASRGTMFGLDCFTLTPLTDL